MNRKKIFGIGAAVIMILVAIIPAVDGVYTALEKRDEIKNDFTKSNYGSWDIKITLDKCEFQSFDEKNEVSKYLIKYTVDNVGEGDFDGPLHPILKKNNSEWEIADWEEGNIKLGPDDTPLHFEHVISIEDEDEYYIAAQDVVLEAGFTDCSGANDPVSGNNYGYGFGKFWKENGYTPLKCHLQRALLHSGWKTGEETFGWNGNVLKIPVFDDTYINIVIPTLFSSDRLGWIGDFIQYLLDFGIVFCDFLAEFIQVAGNIVLLGIELYGLVADLMAMFEQASMGIPPTETEIKIFIGLLTAMVITFGNLLRNIKDLPIDPEDPLRKAVADAGDVFLDFIAGHPWENDIRIEGVVKNCLENENVRLYCRNLKGDEIHGGEGKRTFNNNVTSTWQSGDGLIFRKCQIRIEGDAHSQQKLVSPKLLSYAAAGGKIKFYGGFSKGRTVNTPIFSKFLQRKPQFLPFLKQYFSFQNNPFPLYI